MHGGNSFNVIYKSHSSTFLVHVGLLFLNSFKLFKSLQQLSTLLVYFMMDSGIVFVTGTIRKAAACI